MNQTLTIAVQSLRILWKDKTAFIWMLLLPTIYIFFFGNAFKYENDPSKSKAYLAIHNMDDGILSDLLIEGIRSENIYVDSLSTLPELPTTRLLIIPQDFTKRVLSNKKTELQFETKAGTNIEAETAANMAIRKSYIRLIADLAELNVKDDSVTIDNIRRIENRERLVSVNSRYAGQHKIIPSGYNHQVPANIVMFTMLIIFIYSGQSVLDEKKSGIFRRLLVAPLHFTQLFLGKLLGSTLIGLVQIGILVLIGRLVFQVYYGPSVPALFLLSLMFAASVAAIGLTLGMLIQQEEKMTGIAIILAIAMSAISGCWWPLEVSPAWMVKLASFLPSGIALSGFHQLISYGRGLQAILSHTLKLGIITVLFAVVFGWLLSRMDRTVQ